MLAGLLGLAALALPSSADANPEVEACTGKSEGEACGLLKMVKPEGGELQRKTVPGVCRPDECCELDYSKGSPPQSICNTCLACKDGPADAGPPAADGGAAAGAEGEPPRANNDGPPAPSPAEKRGCTVAAPATPLAGTGLLLLMLGAVRRRR